MWPDPAENWPFRSSEIVPDWVIKSGPVPFQRKDILDYVSDQHHRYDLVALEAFWAETSRPEIPFHSFRPLTANTIQERILIYQPTRLRSTLISRTE